MNNSASDSENVKKLFILAKTAEANGHDSTAYEIYRRIISLDIKRESAIYRAALSLIEIGRLSDAEAHLTQLKWNAAPKPWLIELGLGKLRSAQGRLVEAEKHFANALKLNPSTTATAIFLADCLFKQEKFDEAQNILLASTVAKGHLEELYLNLGLIERAKGNYLAARNYFIEALEAMPNYSDAQKALDDVQACLDLGERGMPVRALEDTELNPEGVKGLIAFAKAAEADEYHSTAYEFYRRVMSLAPKRESATYRAALNLIDIGRLSDAETCLARLKWNAAPKPWLVERALGELRLAQGRFIEAENHFSKAWELNFNGTETGLFLANCLFKEEKFDEAKSVLLGSKRVEDDLDELYRYLGLIERAKANYASARDYLLRAFEISPDYPSGKQILEDVQSALNFGESGVC